VDILLRIDTQEKFKFAPLQSTVGQELLVSIGKQADDISSVVLVKKAGNNGAESYDKSQCVLKVVQELGPVAALASQAALALVPASLRDGIYDTVASNRYRLMGKRDECRCSDPQFAHRFLLD
jgi:predicted DCC family thiol-disulfide oxidoreductase YuxK